MRDSIIELRQAAFNPRLVGSPPYIVHLRYLAVALRVADVLEFDPERTPDVILRHRNVANSSFIYWLKDHEISLKQDGNRLVLFARPPSAVLHRAIDDTGDAVDHELQLARRLAEETFFDKCPGLSEKLPHRWDLRASLYRDIVPLNDCYEYVDGSFRPNTRKVLELVSGTGLYGTGLAALRELIQNAFDAVREKIAYERLALPDRSADAMGDLLAKLHHVKLKCESSPEGVMLTCSDTGVGMTKDIIRDHFLVAGTPMRRDLLRLERKCKDAGFSLERTGQFGIGVLAYFMLADRVVVKTQRSTDCGDVEPNGWRFETEGIGSFGELRKEVGHARGTEVVLRLRSDVVGKDVAQWARQAADYLRRALVRVPCNFEFSTSYLPTGAIKLGPGWVPNEDGLTTRLLLNSLPDPALPPGQMTSFETQQQTENLRRNREEFRAEAKKCLKWEVAEGELPEQSGRFRMHLPYFDLSGGASLAFLRVRSSAEHVILERIGSAYAVIPRLIHFQGWKGMRVGEQTLTPHAEASGLIWEVDWNSPEAGKIALSRNEIALTPIGQKVIEWLRNKATSVKKEFVEAHRDSDYTSFNCSLSALPVSSMRRPKWISIESSEQDGIAEARWDEIEFPAVNRVSVERQRGSLDRPKIEVKWHSQQVRVVNSLPTQIDFFDGLTWNSHINLPDRVAACADHGFRIAPIWTSVRFAKWPLFISCEFPPEWPTLCAAELGSYSGRVAVPVFNCNHPLGRAFSERGFTWCTQRMGQNNLPNPLPFKAELLEEKDRVAGWLWWYLLRGDPDSWTAVKECDPDFLVDVWRLLFGEGVATASQEVPPLCFWAESQRCLKVLTPEHWRTLTALPTLREYLPEPGPEWRLDVKELWT